ncbi:MAG: hypothetical protein GY870_10245 [archaeon]|nr:hypothetical protein [archaeon]
MNVKILMLAHYKEKTTHLLEFLIPAALLFFGLNIPVYSIASVIIVFPIILFAIPENNLALNKSDIYINFLLLSFSTSYYVIRWINGDIALERGIRYIISIQIIYLLGHYAFYFFKHKENELKIMIPVIFIALGFTTFVFLTTLIEAISVKSFFIKNRLMTKSWTMLGLPATLVSVYSSLGIGLLPLGLKLLRLPNKPKLNIILIITFFFMGAVGFISSIMLANRSSFLLLVFIFIFFTAYRAYIKYIKNQLSWIAFALYILIISATVYFFFFADLSFLSKYNIPLLNRFSENNLGFHRSRLWWLSLNHLSTNFWGGKTYALTLPSEFSQLNTILINRLIFNPLYFFDPASFQLPYLAFFNTTHYAFVHNLWLDIHYKTGMLPFCFLIIFHLTHIKNLLIILKGKKQYIAITVLGISVITLFYFMIEPVMTISNRYFMASCFLLAYFRQISKTISIQANKTSST